MMRTELIEFKKSVEDYGALLLTRLDTKIDRIEHELTGVDFKTELFKFEKRLAKIERQKFGFDFSTNHNGDN